MKKNLGNIISWSSVLVVFLSFSTFNPVIIFLGIIIAGIMDMFDGKAARKYEDGSKYSSTFGELTDSLCDIFNFGVAPSLLLSLVVFPEYSMLLLIGSYIFVLGGIFRLARFSAGKDKPKVDYYVGIPITVAGPLLGLFMLFIQDQLLMFTIMVLISYLMVSKIKVKKI